MTLPNFFIVGAEKCGTTALHTCLSTHHQVLMSEPKEPSYFLSFDRRYLTQKMGNLPLAHVSQLPDYEALFALPSGRRARGESSPCYLYSDVAPNKIREAVPDAKIIVLLRHPAERAYSQFVYNQQQGWEKRQRTFREALDLEDQRVAVNDMWAFHYVHRSRYYDQVKYYVDTFGAERVRVWLYEDFNTEPQQVLNEILEFLELQPFASTPEAKRVHVTGIPRAPILHWLTNRPNPIKTVARALTPPSARSTVLRRLRSWNSVKPSADPALLKELEGRFLGDIEKLAAIIKPDPRRWLREQSVPG